MEAAKNKTGINKIAIIIPCLNEEATIGKVVRECQKHIRGATVYVFDNGSDDRTAQRAEEAGAIVFHSPLRGKGNVLKQAFRVIDADFTVMIDGDGTYPVEHAPRMIQLCHDDGYDMVMGSRLRLGIPQAFRPMHYSGNHLLSGLVRFLFNSHVHDLLTGFRVFSRAFIENVRLVSSGFEIETEITLRALMQNLDFCEVEIPYVERPQGSRSKLRTFRDGFIILRTIFRLWRHFKPLLFYPLLAAGAAVLGFNSAAMLFVVLGFYLDWQLEFNRFRLKTRAMKSPAPLSLVPPLHQDPVARPELARKYE